MEIVRKLMSHMAKAEGTTYRFVLIKNVLIFVLWGLGVCEWKDNFLTTPYVFIETNLVFSWTSIFNFEIFFLFFEHKVLNTKQLRKLYIILFINSFVYNHLILVNYLGMSCWLRFLRFVVRTITNTYPTLSGMWVSWSSCLRWRVAAMAASWHIKWWMWR